MTPLAWILSLPVKGYRLVFSPWVGHGCRYQPTCSAYALEALEKHGGVKGSYLAARAAILANDFDRAAEFYTRALVQDPGNVAILESALTAYLGLGEIDRHDVHADGTNAPVLVVAQRRRESRVKTIQALERLYDFLAAKARSRALETLDKYLGGIVSI